MKNFEVKVNSTITPKLPICARHETFHPRYLWLKKGFDKASENSDVFNQEDATIILGVGKNMVKAIR